MEWHPNKNGELSAKELTPGSNKKVWWKCTQGHEWEAIVYDRSAKGVGNLGELKAGGRGAAGGARSQTMRPGAGIN